MVGSTAENAHRTPYACQGSGPEKGLRIPHNRPYNFYNRFTACTSRKGIANTSQGRVRCCRSVPEKPELGIEKYGVYTKRPFRVKTKETEPANP